MKERKAGNKGGRYKDGENEPAGSVKAGVAEKL